MKVFMLILLFPLFFSPAKWLSNFEEAQQLAVEKHRLILLNFSGSDWCGPCIRLHKEIFENAAFINFADSALVLVNADFPRSKKNQLPAEQIKYNEELADRFNPKGKFPFTLLINAEGKIIKEWEGLPNGKAVEFIQQINLFHECYR